LIRREKIEKFKIVREIFSNPDPKEKMADPTLPGSKNFDLVPSL